MPCFETNAFIIQDASLPFRGWLQSRQSLNVLILPDGKVQAPDLETLNQAKRLFSLDVVRRAASQSRWQVTGTGRKLNLTKVSK